MQKQQKHRYEKPELRRVRLEVKTSVLDVCNNSIVTTAKDDPTPGAGCRINICFTAPPLP